MATKAQIIADARSMGVPESLLTGTKAQIQTAIAEWELAHLEASIDTAVAINSEITDSSSTDSGEPSTPRPRDTAAGPWMLLGVALFG